MGVQGCKVQVYGGLGIQECVDAGCGSVRAPGYSKAGVQGYMGRTEVSGRGRKSPQLSLGISKYTPKILGGLGVLVTSYTYRFTFSFREPS